MEAALPQMQGMEGMSNIPKNMGKESPMSSLHNRTNTFSEMASDLVIQPLIDIGRSVMSAFSILWPF